MDPVRLLYNIRPCCDIIVQVVFWVELPVKRRLCPIFVKSWVSEKKDLMVWCRVTRHPQISRGLTGCQRTPKIWSVIAWYQSIGIRIPRARWALGLDHYMHCTFSCCVQHDYDCVIVCYNCVNYIHSRMYIVKNER